MNANTGSAVVDTAGRAHQDSGRLSEKAIEMPLTYRDKGTSGTQLAIYSHNLCIGHVGKEFDSILSGQRARWHWTFGLNTAVPKGFPLHGSAPSLDEATAIIEQAWQDWLTTAGLIEK